MQSCISILWGSSLFFSPARESSGCKYLWTMKEYLVSLYTDLQHRCAKVNLAHPWSGCWHVQGHWQEKGFDCEIEFPTCIFRVVSASPLKATEENLGTVPAACPQVENSNWGLSGHRQPEIRFEYAWWQSRLYESVSSPPKGVLTQRKDFCARGWVRALTATNTQTLRDLMTQ